MTALEAQTPARGISLAGDYGDAKNYHIECDCSSTEHSIKMWIEVNGDKETQDVEVGFYVDTWTPFWDKKFNRFRTAWNVLFNGVNRQEHHIILNKQAALNLAKVVESTVIELDSR
jgi:hypothetical protein